MNGPSRAQRARQGFTFIEVIVVLVVLGILAVALVSGMNPHASVAVEADILRSHLGYAQSLAIANNVAIWSVAFSSGAYSLLRDGAPSAIPWPGESSATYSLPAGVAIGPGAGVVVFNQWGAPDASYAVTLSDGTQQQQVLITGFTGLVP